MPCSKYRVALFDICLYSVSTCLCSVRNNGSSRRLKGFSLSDLQALVLPNVGPCPSLSVSDPKWLSVPCLGGRGGGEWIFEILCSNFPPPPVRIPQQHLFWEHGLGRRRGGGGQSSLSHRAAPPIFIQSKLGCFPPWREGKVSPAPLRFSDWAS